MRTVVAAEATGKIVVAEIIGVHTPIHVHLREDVPEIEDEIVEESRAVPDRGLCTHTESSPNK
jgi:hypothetical protein